MIGIISAYISLLAVNVEQSSTAPSGADFVRCGAWATLGGRGENSADLMREGAERLLQEVERLRTSEGQLDGSWMERQGADFFTGYLVGTLNALTQQDIYNRVPDSDGLDGLPARASAAAELARNMYLENRCDYLLMIDGVSPEGTPQ